MKSPYKQEQEIPELMLNSEYIRLLLVDDNVQDTEVLRKMILPYDEIEFFHCNDPSQAIKLAIDVQPTVILVALFMTATNGLDLIKAFREQEELADVSLVIVYSKEEEPINKEDMFLSGADDCLIKSYGKVETISRIFYHSRTCIEHRALQDAIKELEETRTQIYKSEKMASIGQLAAGVAHEINNPIAFVTSNINSMCGYYDDVFSVIDTYKLLEFSLSADKPEVKAVREVKKRLQLNYIREDIEKILSECKDGLTRIRKIVDDLKNFSREEVEWQQADLHKEMDSTLNIANHEIKYKAEVIKNYGEIPNIECVPSQLNQVFLNLFVNAAQAIDDHGTITLTTSTGSLPESIAKEMTESKHVDEGSWVCISVADTGSGIDTVTIKHIFDTFFTTKPVGKGTGLGLSLSRNIVQKHGGYIAVESEYGKGTTFSIWLPVLQHDTTEC